MAITSPTKSEEQPVKVLAVDRAEARRIRIAFERGFDQALELQRTRLIVAWLAGVVIGFCLHILWALL